MSFIRTAVQTHVCVYLSKVPPHREDIVSTSFKDNPIFIHDVLLSLLLIRQIHRVIYSTGTAS